MDFETGAAWVYQNTHNPLLPLNHHMPDVEVHVMSDGKLYLYGSYDDCKKEYCSNFYRVASTADMKSWKISDKVMKGMDVPWFDENASVEVLMTSQGPGNPFTLGETIYGYQACKCSGKCYILWQMLY